MADLTVVGGIELPLPELPGSGHQENIYNEFIAVFNSLRRIQSVLNVEMGLAAASTEVLPSMGISDGVSVAKSKLYVELIEAASFGQMLSITPSGGAAKARLASNVDEAHRCWGICNTPGSHAIGAVIECALGVCVVESVGGMTPGQEYYLSSVGGAITNAPDPLTETNIRQSIGLAITGTLLLFAPQAPGKLVSIIITP